MSFCRDVSVLTRLGLGDMHFQSHASECFFNFAPLVPHLPHPILGPGARTMPGMQQELNIHTWQGTECPTR